PRAHTDARAAAGGRTRGELCACGSRARLLERSDRHGPADARREGLVSGSYDDPYGQKNIGYQSGSWTSDWVPVAFAFDELVASWNAETPASTWIKLEMQARGSGRE